MTVLLEIEVIGEALDDGTYQVVWEVVNHSGIPSEVFLHTSSTGSFHGAVAPSQLIYPTSPDEGTAYFRKSIASKTFESIEKANKAKDNIDQAIADLVEAVEEGLQEFLIPVTYTYPR